MSTAQDVLPADQQKDVQPWLAACGVAGPLIFTIVVAFLGLIRPDYSHATQLVSELGEPRAPYAMVMNLFGFILFGLLMIPFAVGLHRGIRKGRGSWIGPALLVVAGVAMAAEGVFPCDPGCPDNPTTLTGRIHFPIATMILAFSWLLAPIFLGFRMRKDPRWRGHSVYSFLTVLVFFALFLLARPVIAPALGGGIAQRLFLAVPIPLWILVTALRLYRLAGEGAT